MARPVLGADALPGPNAKPKDQAQLCPQTDACRSIPALYDDTSTPPVDIQWSLGLRGSFIKDRKSEHYEAVASPEVTLTREGLRGSVSVTGSADLVRPSDDTSRVGSADVSGKADYALDEWTTLGLRGGFSMSQASRHDSSLPDNTAAAPIHLSGNAAATVSRSFAHSTATLTARIERNTYTDTKLTDGTRQSNKAYDRTRYGGELRLDHELTPVIGVFGDGRFYYDAYDSTVPGLGVKADGWTGSLRAGVTGNWLDVFSAEASVGFGKRHYDTGAIPDTHTRLYDLSATFKPNETLTLTGGYTTEIAPGDVSSGATASITRTASADAVVTVNQWLGLRGSVSSARSEYVGTGEVTKTLSAGVGADMSVAEHTTVSADYDFSRTEKNTASAEDTHTFTLGVTVAR